MILIAKGTLDVMAWDRSLGVRIPYQRLFLEEGTYVCAGCGHVACSRTDRNLFVFPIQRDIT